MYEITTETNKTKAQLTAGFSRSALEADSIKPLDGIDTVWFLGASILTGIISGRESLMEKYLKHFYGLDVTVENHSLSGRDTTDVRNYFATKASSIAGQSNVLVMQHGFGNTITANKPYSSLDQSTIDSLKANLLGLQTDVENNGNTCMMIETSFRDYDFETVQNELLGSEPFNRNILFEVVKQGLTSNWYNDRPYCTWYEFTRNYYHLIGTDGTHYEANVGYGGAMFRYIGDMIGRRILGMPPVFSNRDSDPFENKASARAILINPTDGEATGVSPTALGANSLDMTASSSGVKLVNQFGYTPPSVEISNTAGVLTMAANDYADGDITPSLNSDVVKNSVGYTNSASYVDLFTLSGFKPNQEVKFTILSLRSTISDSRIASFSTDGGATEVQINARDFIGIDNIGEYTNVCDGNGAITLSMRLISGSNCYFTGCIVETV